ncbi:MAG: hypothetical protein M0O99_02150 [Desulfuromonas thiophila]|jgi:hypothetical protein|nr:hypothetical protein [Desulfuromonas thiophila]
MIPACKPQIRVANVGGARRTQNACTTSLDAAVVNKFIPVSKHTNLLVWKVVDPGFDLASLTRIVSAKNVLSCLEKRIFLALLDISPQNPPPPQKKQAAPMLQAAC